MKTKTIKTLEQFANLLNSKEEWEGDYYEIIDYNRWLDETGDGLRICSDGTNRLEYNEDGIAVIIKDTRWCN